MRPAILTIILLFCFISTIKSQEKNRKNDSILFVEKTLHKVSKKINFAIAPGPVYGVSQKLGFVILPMIVYNLKKRDTVSSPSSTALLFYVDLYGSWALALKQSLYWNQDKWRAFVNFGVNDMKMKFFGIGQNKTIINNNDSNYVWTRNKGVNVSATCFRKIYKGLYGGLEYSYNQSVFDGTDSLSTEKIIQSGLTPGKSSESTISPAFIWDDRNNIYWTTKGYYAGLSFQFANKALSSSVNYNILVGYVNGYHRLLKNSDKLILAWHFYTQAGWGEFTFPRYANYGKGDDVTGYTGNKYVNNSEATLQTEMRFEIWKFISGGGYFGTGKIFSSYDIFGQSAWLHFGGIRLYFNIIPSRNIRLRIDAAISRKDYGFYIGIGQAF
jgi:outer membrane protein assembly factor BamA